MRICTTNKGKLREFGGILLPLGIQLLPSERMNIPEPFDTFADNARAKAQGYAPHYPGEYILAEDSGIVVPALKGLPGPHSARFYALDLTTGELAPGDQLPGHIADPLNNAKLMEAMKDVPTHQRGAYFAAALCVLSPSGEVIFEHEERAYGWVVDSPRGESGFGYDPIFESPETYGLTWAQVDGMRKNLISHRTKTVYALMRWACTRKDLK